jgi:hypothetical protein
MKDVDALVALHTGFDGHLFRSKAGKLRVHKAYKALLHIFVSFSLC